MKRRRRRLSSGGGVAAGLGALLAVLLVLLAERRGLALGRTPDWPASGQSASPPAKQISVNQSDLVPANSRLLSIGQTLAWLSTSPGQNQTGSQRPAPPTGPDSARARALAGPMHFQPPYNLSGRHARLQAPLAPVLLRPAAVQLAGPQLISSPPRTHPSLGPQSPVQVSRLAPPIHLPAFYHSLGTAGPLSLLTRTQAPTQAAHQQERPSHEAVLPAQQEKPDAPKWRPSQEPQLSTDNQTGEPENEAPLIKQKDSSVQYEQPTEEPAMSAQPAAHEPEPDWERYSWPQTGGAQEQWVRQHKQIAGSYQRSQPSGNLSWAELLRQAAHSNALESLLVTNRSMASLLCETDHMLLRLRFRTPFQGLVFAGMEASQECRLNGSGAHSYEWRIPLQVCGTRHESPRLFINHIHIHYHHSLELEDQETKTIICSYPVRGGVKPVPSVPPTLVPPRGANERVIEEPADTNEPAKLVHYEPFVLIAGLIMLTLILLALTSSAYLLTKRSGRWASATSSSGQHKRSPARQANRPSHLMAPPLIGLASSYEGIFHAIRYPSGRRRRRRRSKIRGKNNDSDAVFMDPEPEQSQQKQQRSNSGDSLAGKQSGSDSVTTIEIPYLPQVNQAVKPEPASIPNTPEPLSPDNDVKEQATRQQLNNEQPASPSGEAEKKTKRKSKTTVTHDTTIRQTRCLQQFGSLKTTLTSPREFKRLQEIARLFDEIQIENHIDKGMRRTMVYKTTRLNPSKYKSKILDRMDEQDRRTVSHLLRNDELFRSLVVDSIDRETFQRKLRRSSMFSDKLKPDTWKLLEEILIDPDLGVRDSPTNKNGHNSDSEPNVDVVESPSLDEESVLAQVEMVRLSPNSTTRAAREDSLEATETGLQAGEISERLRLGTRDDSNCLVSSTLILKY